MLFTVVVSVYADHQIFLPRVLTGLINQSFNDFELIVEVDGESPLSPYDPDDLCRQTVAAQVVYLPRTETWGFRGRHHALGLAKGEYITWLSSDNLVYPNWLQNHAANVARKAGAISVVNIQYWRDNVYRSTYPRSLEHGGIDLLNYAVPLELARRLDVFGPDLEHIPYADWIVFKRCTDAAPVVWDKEQPVCACHF